MNKTDFIPHLKNLGLSEKASRIYLASLELGEATILELSKKTRISRTTIYYSIRELLEKGMLIETLRGKKTHFMYVEPSLVFKEERQKILEFDEILPELEEVKWQGNMKPRIEFYFGVSGFKEVWMKILKSGIKDYALITDPNHFSGYVKDKYIRGEIVVAKIQAGMKSRQLIVESNLSKYIVAKDSSENRTSKFLPHDLSLGFTEIITDKFVVFISDRIQNIIFSIDHEEYAKTRKNFFNLLWNKF